MAIATAVVDLLILILLLIITRKYATKAVFNLNNLKILVASILVAVASYFLDHYLPYEGFVDLILILCIDAFLYLGLLILLQEKLVTSFIRKDRKEKKKG